MRLGWLTRLTIATCLLGAYAIVAALPQALAAPGTPDELHVFNVPSVYGPLDLYVAPLSAPLAGDFIVSDAGYAELAAMPPAGTFPYQTADTDKSEGSVYRVHRLAVTAPDGNAVATAMGDHIDDPETAAPTVAAFLAGAYRPVAPASTAIVGTAASVVDGACNSECPGWLPRSLDYGAATLQTIPPFPAGTIGGDGAVMPAAAGGGVTAQLVELAPDDRHRLDLLWQGVWGLLGLALVGLVAPLWLRAFGRESSV